MASIWVIARLTVREAARRWVLWVALILGILFLAIYAIGFNEIQKDIGRQRSTMNAVMMAEMQNFMTMAGLYGVNFLALMMAVLTSVDTVSGEITSGTIHTLVSKPLSRWQVLVGKWLGFIGMLTLYLALMGGGVIALSYALAGYLVPHPAQGLFLMWAAVFLVLNVSFLGGASLSTLANGVLVFGLYGVAFIGGWVEQIGSILQNQAAINVGILTSLIMPSEVLWKRAAYEMQSPLSAALGFSPFITSSAPSLLMIIYALGYALVMLALAVWRFSRRDL